METTEVQTASSGSTETPRSCEHRLELNWLVVSTYLKNISQNGIISPNRGENKKYWKPPPSKWWNGTFSNLLSFIHQMNQLFSTKGLFNMVKQGTKNTPPKKNVVIFVPVPFGINPQASPKKCSNQKFQNTSKLEIWSSDRSYLTANNPSICTHKNSPAFFLDDVSYSFLPRWKCTVISKI